MTKFQWFYAPNIQIAEDFKNNASFIDEMCATIVFWWNIKLKYNTNLSLLVLLYFIYIYIDKNAKRWQKFQLQIVFKNDMSLKKKVVDPPISPHFGEKIKIIMFTLTYPVIVVGDWSWMGKDNIYMFVFFLVKDCFWLRNSVECLIVFWNGYLL